MLHFSKDWWKFIQIHQYYIMALCMKVYIKNVVYTSISLIKLLILLSDFAVRPISSAENQKGINVVQQCSVDNQKGTMVIDFVQW